MNNLDRRIFRGADDGLDGPALPVPPSPADAPRAAVHRDGDERGDHAWRPRAAAWASIRMSIRWRCSSAGRTRLSWRRRRGSAKRSATTRSTSTSAVPSDRVQSGRFGACLMAEPELVAACVSRDARCDRHSGDGQVPHRHRRAGHRGEPRPLCRPDGRGRGRCALRPCAQGLAQGAVAEGEPRDPAARLSARPPAGSAACAVPGDRSTAASRR